MAAFMPLLKIPGVTLRTWFRYAHVTRLGRWLKTISDLPDNVPDVAIVGDMQPERIFM
jgi:hypothetical protein